MPEEEEPRHYKPLKVWQRAMELAKLTYAITSKFPAEEKFGLTAQMRRAAVSIVSNIAEGQARHGRSEFLQFLSHAYGSSAELESQYLLSRDFGFCNEADFSKAAGLIDEVQKMLSALRRSLSPVSEERSARHSPPATRH